MSKPEEAETVAFRCRCGDTHDVPYGEQFECEECGMGFQAYDAGKVMRGPLGRGADSE